LTTTVQADRSPLTPQPFPQWRPASIGPQDRLSGCRAHSCRAAAAAPCLPITTAGPPVLASGFAARSSSCPQLGPLLGSPPEPSYHRRRPRDGSLGRRPRRPVRTAQVSSAAFKIGIRPPRQVHSGTPPAGQAALPTPAGVYVRLKQGPPPAPAGGQAGRVWGGGLVAAGRAKVVEPATADCRFELRC